MARGRVVATIAIVFRSCRFAGCSSSVRCSTFSFYRRGKFFCGGEIEPTTARPVVVIIIVAVVIVVVVRGSRCDSSNGGGGYLMLGLCIKAKTSVFYPLKRCHYHCHRHRPSHLFRRSWLRSWCLLSKCYSCGKDVSQQGHTARHHIHCGRHAGVLVVIIIIIITVTSVSSIGATRHHRPRQGSCLRSQLSTCHLDSIARTVANRRVVWRRVSDIIVVVVIVGVSSECKGCKEGEKNFGEMQLGKGFYCVVWA